MLKETSEKAWHTSTALRYERVIRWFGVGYRVDILTDADSARSYAHADRLQGGTWRTVVALAPGAGDSAKLSLSIELPHVDAFRAFRADGEKLLAALFAFHVAD